jgi:hypothetical protein
MYATPSTFLRRLGNDESGVWRQEHQDALHHRVGIRFGFDCATRCARSYDVFAHGNNAGCGEIVNTCEETIYAQQ